MECDIPMSDAQLNDFTKDIQETSQSVHRKHYQTLRFYKLVELAGPKRCLAKPLALKQFCWKMFGAYPRLVLQLAKRNFTFNLWHIYPDKPSNFAVTIDKIYRYQLHASPIFFHGVIKLKTRGLPWRKLYFCFFIAFVSGYAREKIVG